MSRASWRDAVAAAWGGLLARDVQEALRVAFVGHHPLVVVVEGEPAPYAAALRAVTDAYGERSPAMPPVGVWRLPRTVSDADARRMAREFHIGVVVPGIDAIATDADGNGPAVEWSVAEVIDEAADARRRRRSVEVSRPALRVIARLLGADAPAWRVDRVAEVARTLAAIDGLGDVTDALADEAVAMAPEVAVLAGWRRRPTRTPGIGRVVVAYDAAGAEYRLRYRFVDLGALVVSHDDDLRPTPGYPAELQPRERARVASQAQIDRIARLLQPALLADDRSVAAGAPVVGPDLVVESGNGRAIALRRAALRYPAQFAAYREYLARRAGAWGLRADDLDGIDRPVLVRERLTEVDRRRFVEAANVAAVASSGAAEVAKTDARRMDLAILAKFQPLDEGGLTESILAPRNRAFVTEFMAGVPENERARMIDADGQLSADGARRIATAIVERVYGGGDVSVTDLIAEASDPGARNVLNGIAAAGPAMARARALIEARRRHPLDIGADLAWAARAMSRASHGGESIEGLLAQRSLIPSEALSPVRAAILRGLYDRRRSGKAVRELLERYAALVERSPDPDQRTMFGSVPAPTILDLWTRAAAGEGAAQPSLGLL